MPETAKVERNQRKTRVGVVTSDKMQKTIIVRVNRVIRHPLYTRTLTRGSSLKAHDESNQARVGDRVSIMETRRLSKNKRWRLVKVLRQASTAPAVPEEESEVHGREVEAARVAAHEAQEKARAEAKEAAPAVPDETEDSAE